MTSATLHRAPAAIATTDTPHPESLLRARTRYYERHVLAWYALGRVHDARAAWAAVLELRRAA